MTTVNVLSLEGGVRQGLETLRQMPVRLGEVLEAIRLEAVNIGLDQSLSLTGKNEAYNRSATKFMNQVEQMEAQSKALHDDLQRWIAQQLGKPHGNAAEELLFEFRVAQAWRRIERVLDSVEQRTALLRTVEDLVSEFVKLNDQVGLEALQAELGSYFRARNMTTPSDLAKRISEARAVHASPQERLAIALRDELAVGFPRLTTTFGEVKRAIQTRSTIAILPGWTTDERITLNLPKEPATYTWQ